MAMGRLTRSNDAWIAGVCGGIAEYFGWPAGRVRLAYVLLSALSAAFPGIAVYIVLWILMPPPSAETRVDPAPRTPY
jgi:phage shock protein PspC (stress-responsive transcriptional regulator)